MATILKEPEGRSKGVIVFTHKERHLIREGAYRVGPLVSRLRERYVVAMHWGWFFDHVEPLPWVDVHLAREDTVRFLPGSKVRMLPFNSSLFTPEYFRPRPEVPKHWDIISVTRSAKFKNTDQLLECLRLVLDRRPETRALVVCVAPTRRSRTHDDDLLDLYARLFDERMREQVSFDFVRSDSLFPLSRRDIAFFYNASRVFTLFTDTEGVAKVVKEAMLCGLPAVAKAHLRGGGSQLFDARNSRTFTTLDEGADAFVDLLDHYEDVVVDTDGLAREASEIFTVPRFEQALRDLFAELGVPFAGPLALHDLGRRLPSHVPHEIPAHLRLPKTSDLRSREAMVVYLQHVLEGQPLEGLSLGLVAKARLRAEARLEWLARLGRVVRRRVAQRSARPS